MPVFPLSFRGFFSVILPSHTSAQFKQNVAFYFQIYYIILQRKTIGLLYTRMGLSQIDSFESTLVKFQQKALAKVIGKCFLCRLSSKWKLFLNLRQPCSYQSYFWLLIICIGVFLASNIIGIDKADSVNKTVSDEITIKWGMLITIMLNGFSTNVFENSILP